MKPTNTKSIVFLFIVILCAVLLSACGNAGTSGAEGATAAGSAATISYTDGFSIKTDIPQAVQLNGNIYTFTQPGEYELSGSLNGRLIVDAGNDSDITLILNGVTITSDSGCPLAVMSADTVELKSKSGTVNEINHTQASVLAEGTADARGKAAVYSKANLELTGSGELDVNAACNNGIQVKKNFVIKDTLLNVTAQKNAIKASETITMKSGTVTLNAQTGDGMKTVESDISKKGNLHGLIAIEGGSLTIYAEDDGIHAETELTINDGEVRVMESYEGLEGHTININGGVVYAYATDDAVNGSSNGSGLNDATVTVNAGSLEAVVPSGDTDALDVNGSFIQNGGMVLLRGGAPEGNVRGSIDIEETIKINKGTIVAVGGICNLPEDSISTYIEEGTVLPAGDYSVLDDSGAEIAAFTLPQEYTSFWISADGFTPGAAYRLMRGEEQVSTWTIEK